MSLEIYLAIDSIAGMGKKSSGPHTVESMKHVVARLREIASQIEVVADGAAMQPAIGELEVPLEVSLIDGSQFLQDWADSLRDAVRAEKLRLARIHDPKKPVSVSKPAPHKPKVK